MNAIWYKNKYKGGTKEMKHNLKHQNHAAGFIQAISAALVFFLMFSATGLPVMAEGEDAANSTGETTTTETSGQATTEENSTGNTPVEKSEALQSEAGVNPVLKTDESAENNAPEGDAANVLAATDDSEIVPETTPTDFVTSDPAAWDHSKSITATNLDPNYESEITLSLPSAEEQLTTEVCFVLDKSSFSDTKEKAMGLLGELKKAAENTGAKVQVDIVEFNRTGHDHGSYDLATQYDEIEGAFAKQNSGGTNLEAGLLVAQEVLSRRSDIPDSRKYMVLVSDGDTYLHCKGGDYKTPYSRSYISVEQASGTAYGGYYDESWYNPSAPYEGNTGRPTDNSPEAWEKYLKDVAARNTESSGDSYDFVWKYYDGWQNMTTEQIAADGFKTMPAKIRSASNFDIALLQAANVYHTLAAKYHCYSIAVQSLNQPDGGHSAFMEYLNGNAVATFDGIKNEILYLLDAGSTVVGSIGYVENDYNFDLAAPEKMTITVDDTENGGTVTYPAKKISENQFGFGENGQGNYSYVVTYVPGDKKAQEYFTWTINVPVTNFQHVSLKYKVKLMDPKNVAGTYGEYDADGSLKKAGLYISNQTVLKPMNSNQQTSGDEEFQKPTVSYTVKAASTPAAPAPAGSYDDGGPFTKNECGNVYDRWGNLIWASPACRVFSKKVPGTGAGY
ncbi:vWA domain-containing protein [Galactobacillus timonensis]|uniref:vWA domain-containing protein n=1 Tax=Galactobacillus timonensis TaxID=2041840 RepID=UPI0023F12DD5|nr:vWA domain-containing protein [Galactobacillus timonensis]